MGLHVDMATLEANPGLLPEAQSMGIPVFTYHLGADRNTPRPGPARQNQLVAIRRDHQWHASAFCDVLAKP